MENTLISIIIPVYNAEKYLAECLESLLKQSYQNLEILVINDGSQDNSKKVALEYANQDSRIVYYEQENRGQSAARNVGINQAKGDYLIFVDGDDAVGKYHVEELANAVSEEVRVAGVKFTKIADEVAQQYERNYTNYAGSFEELVAALYQTGFPIMAAWAKIYHASLFDEVRFHEGIIYEDGILFYEIIHQVTQINLVDSTSYFYRTAENSTLTSQISQKNYDVFKKNCLLESFFKKEHPNMMRHFYQRALNLNDSIAVRCQINKSELSKDLSRKLFEQNRVYAKAIFPRKVLYLNYSIYCLLTRVVAIWFKRTH